CRSNAHAHRRQRHHGHSSVSKGLIDIMRNSRALFFFVLCLCVLTVVAASLPRMLAGREAGQARATTEKQTEAASVNAAVRLNNLGVAKMNQERFAEAQKFFEQALAGDAKFYLARLNLGISLFSQRKLSEARQTLQKVAEQLPGDPAVWYNLGLVERDL